MVERHGTICFYCGFGILNWFGDKDPGMDNAYWNPQCQFLLCNKNKKLICQAFNACVQLVDGEVLD